MLDPDGHMATWNAGAEPIKGYRAEEIIGRHFTAFYTPESIERGEPAAHLAEAAANGRLQHRDGTLRGFAKVTRD